MTNLTEVGWLVQNIFPETFPSVHIWSINTTLFKTDKITSFLSHDEREKSLRFVFDADKKSFKVCRGVLRFLLGKYLNCEPLRVVFNYNRFGKPILAPSFDNGVSFNVSHSGAYALLIFCRGKNIGVDIEFNRQVDFESLSEVIFSAHEIEEFKKNPPDEKLKAFYSGWTKKESFVKGIGKGLSFPLKDFSISLRHNLRKCAVKDGLSKNNYDPLWTVYEIPFYENYSAAFAIEGDENILIEKFILTQKMLGII